MNKVNRIALIGPESSGKTDLCVALARHYHTFWVPEYAREYIGKLGRKYTAADILLCSEQQWVNEQSLLARANRYLFTDTEFIVAKVWHEDRFGPAPEAITQMIDKYPYDLYLLTTPDIPFEHDPVRENPDRRDYFYNLYKSELDERQLPYAIISGQHEKRFDNAVSIIDKFFT